MSLSEDCPAELIAFFDPSIEYIRVKQDGKDTGGYLKFFDKPEIKLNRLSDIDRYLSSGTIKGINTFLCAMKTFNNGGYLIVDELENHFNHEIVSTLIRFYMDSKVNRGGATLIFSTHYAEILDEFERNDSIYIVRNRNGITVENLSKILKRNDIKKSEAYESDFLKGTVPSTAFFYVFDFGCAVRFLRRTTKFFAFRRVFRRRSRSVYGKHSTSERLFRLSFFVHSSFVKNKGVSFTIISMFSDLNIYSCYLPILSIKLQSARIYRTAPSAVF